MQTVTVTANTGSTHEVPVAHPFALLWTSVDGSPKLKALLLERLAVHPSSLESPWHLVLYSDEVTPGNVLAFMNVRKFQAVYFSFFELGATALSHEESWWCVLVEFSKVINDLSAMMSQMFAKILKLFFNPEGNHLTNTGVNLPVTEDGLRLFAVLGAFLQDGGAHKSTWHCRGDGASKPCLLCKNLFTESSNVCDEDGTNLLRCNVIKKADLVQATSRDMRRAARHLESQVGTMSLADFTELQQALGITHHQLSLLLDRSLDEIVDPSDAYLHDWQHGLFVDGVVPITVYLLFEEFIQNGKRYISRALLLHSALELAWQAAY